MPGWAARYPSGGMHRHRLREFSHLHEEPSSVTHNESVAFQLCQVLGDSWARGTDEIGDVLMAEGYSQERAARLFDTKL